MATCGAETLDSRPAGQWSSTRPCITATVNLFGGGYLGQVKQTLRLLLGFLD